MVGTDRPALVIGGPTGATALALALGALGLMMIPDRPRTGTVRSPPTPKVAIADGSVRRAAIGTLAVVAAGLLLAPGLWWASLLAAGLTWILLSRRPKGRSAAQRAVDRTMVAVLCELFAACLDSGMAVGPALRAVTGVVTEGEGPVGHATTADAPHRDASSRQVGQAAPLGSGARGPIAVLDAVAAMLTLGASPTTAWRPADLDEDLAPLAAAARRSAAGGGGLSQAVREHAAQLRADTAAASVRAAGRAGVLMTAPLGVCFLPAFLCLGLAPVVVGLLGQLEIF